MIDAAYGAAGMHRCQKAHIQVVPSGGTKSNCSPCGRKAERTFTKGSFLFSPTREVLGIKTSQYNLLLSRAVEGRQRINHQKFTFWFSCSQERAEKVGRLHLLIPFLPSLFGVWENDLKFFFHSYGVMVKRCLKVHTPHPTGTTNLVALVVPSPL